MSELSSRSARRPFFRGRFCSSFVRDQRASILMLFGLAAPVLLLLAAGTVELAEVVKTKHALQWEVDEAALNGARELGTDQSSATAERARVYAAKLAAQATARWTVQTTAQANTTSGSMTVVQTASRPSFFGNLLPPGGWRLDVTGTAVANSKVPLCVLGLQSGSQQAVSLLTSSAVTAANCLVQSDSNISAAGGTAMTAAAVRSVGSATGSISPPPVTDAPPISDPFFSLNIDVPPQCNDQGLVLGNGTHSLNPGVHCGTFQLTASATLVLNPGEHYFQNGSFDVRGNAQITGNDAVLIFKGETLLQFRGNGFMSFDGRQTGPYAGFVLVADRSFTGTLGISTDSAHKLHGTIYLPNATLAVAGAGNKVADQSPWTVVVAKALTTDGSANLVINSNYAGSPVPVPRGVGSSGEVHLTN